MEVNVLELFTEYLAMLCGLYRLSKHQPDRNVQNIIRVIVNFMCVFVCMYYYGMGTKICGYICILLFAKRFFCINWKDAIKFFGFMAVVILGLQLVLYVLVGSSLIKIVDPGTVGFIENCILIVVFAIWKRRYSEIVLKTIIWIKEGIYIIVFFLFFFYLFYTRNEMKQLNPQSIM